MQTKPDHVGRQYAADRLRGAHPAGPCPAPIRGRSLARRRTPHGPMPSANTRMCAPTTPERGQFARDAGRRTLTVLFPAPVRAVLPAAVTVHNEGVVADREPEALSHGVLPLFDARIHELFNAAAV